MNKEIITINASSLTAAKRAASRKFNFFSSSNVINSFYYKGLKFTRINKVSPAETIDFGKWD